MTFAPLPSSYVNCDIAINWEETGGKYHGEGKFVADWCTGQESKALHIRCHYGPKSTIMLNGNAPEHYFLEMRQKLTESSSMSGSLQGQLKTYICESLHVTLIHEGSPGRQEQRKKTKQT